MLICRYKNPPQIITSEVEVINEKLGLSRTYTAVWDTGADTSNISTRVIQDLNLKESFSREVLTTTKTQRSLGYDVSIRIPEISLIVTNVGAISFTENQYCDVLIGMDIIPLGDFSLS